jgi:hypothetical protein
MNREISGMVACLVTPLAFSTPSLFRFASRQEDLHRKLGPGVDAARKLVERQLSCPWGRTQAAQDRIRKTTHAQNTPAECKLSRCAQLPQPLPAFFCLLFSALYRSRRLIVVAESIFSFLRGREVENSDPGILASKEMQTALVQGTDHPGRSPTSA